MTKPTTAWLPARKIPGKLTAGSADTRVTANASIRVTADGSTRVTSGIVYTPKETTSWQNSL